jgi:hypothetical protein
MTLKPVDFGYDPADLCDLRDRPFYQPVTITWSKPRPLSKSGPIEIPDDYIKPGYLYALVRNHGNSSYLDTIVYIGITNSLHQRFRNHPKVDEIRAARGMTGLSIGEIDFHGRRTTQGAGHRPAIEELEHILIWSLWDDLWNEKKQYTLPGMGANRGRAWEVRNEGYKFCGRMPKRIIYPFILIEPRRNRTVKRRS